MFDDKAFSRAAFEDRSWLFAALATGRRFIVKLKSAIQTRLVLISKVW